jgi:hypothetical protein
MLLLKKRIGLLLGRGKSGLRNVVLDGTAKWAERKKKLPKKTLRIHLTF